jgi:hypothetical protein
MAQRQFHGFPLLGAQLCAADRQAFGERRRWQSIVGQKLSQQPRRVLFISPGFFQINLSSLLVEDLLAEQFSQVILKLGGGQVRKLCREYENNLFCMM